MEIQLNQDVLDAIRLYSLPRYHEIPEVGLYLNQVAKYVNIYMRPFCDMNITEAMIGNYVKKRLVANPREKQYSREQLAYLLFIAVAKSVLSLNHIQLLLDIQKQTYDSQVAYDYFCCEFENALQYVFGIKSSMDNVGEETDDAKFLLRNVIVAATHKIYLDHCFCMIEKRE